jgi:hypothetical protein
MTELENILRGQDRLFSEALLPWMYHGPALPKRYSKGKEEVRRSYGGTIAGAKLVRSW